MNFKDPPQPYNFDLGNWTRQITSPSKQAQIWFDRGLNWLYAYNHEEAVACFRRALVEDDQCAMAWWGVAYASGPFYNRPWIRYSPSEIAHFLPVCVEAAKAASRYAGSATRAERALIEAISVRYQDDQVTDHATLNTWHEAFTQAMRTAYLAHTEDLDITAFFVEAAITCTPRQLWDLKTGVPKSTAHTEEALAILEKALAATKAMGIIHPGLNHMYLHALEMSPFPERAIEAADELRGYAPDAGHLEHMPAHIYVLCGDYAQAVEQSRRAVKADDLYLAFAGTDNFYTTARCHDLHLYMYAAMFLGQFHTAMEAAERICETATPDLLKASPPFMAAILDGYSAMRIHVLVRFGKWRELTLLPLPENPGLTPISAAMRPYGKGVAHAALGEISESEEAQEEFRQAVARISDDHIFLSNPVVTMLAVGDAMLEGELAYRKGNYEVAFAALRLAVEQDDNLNYTEPWAWMHPPRHALGALLAEQGRYDEAEAVYRADLGYDNRVARCTQHPDNVWALHGLLECVEQAGRMEEVPELRQKLRTAQAKTDIEITSSCCCRMTHG